MTDDTKRLFFACEIKSPWPHTLPKGRIIQESDRHLTLAFLGNTSFSKVEELLPAIPPPPFKVGLAGEFDGCLFLPEKDPRVVAWHLNFHAEEKRLIEFQKNLIEWLEGAEYPITHKEFLPHVTLARKEFDQKAWEEACQPLPAVMTGLHLYETQGELIYRPIWSYPMLPPFEVISHTADIAFKIYGESIKELFLNAQFALAFEFPEILMFLKRDYRPLNLDEVIVLLNEIVTEIDKEHGCPFKAVSFHGEIQTNEHDVLEWEMIVDV